MQWIQVSMGMGGLQANAGLAEDMADPVWIQEPSAGCMQAAGGSGAVKRDAGRFTS